MSDWTRRSRWLMTQLAWNRGDPDPRVLQSTFPLLLVGGLVIRWIGEGPVGWVSWPVAGVVIAIVIRVIDTGIGIPSEHHDQVFDRFFRTDEATRLAIQGVGLGLSVSKSIVDGHGGRIEVDSEPGRGSEFRVVLPVHASRMAS